MKIELIKVSMSKRPLDECEDFAKLRWPKGATDYLAGYSNGNKVVVGRHVNGWTSGVKRKGVKGWNFLFDNCPEVELRPNQVIWAKVTGERCAPYELVEAIAEEFIKGGKVK